MKPDVLYLTEAEIAARLGIPAEDWKTTAVVLERQGFPKPESLFRNRRYWPACRAFLDRRYDLSPGEREGNPALDGEEKWNLSDQRTTARRRA